MKITISIPDQIYNKIIMYYPEKKFSHIVQEALHTKIEESAIERWDKIKGTMDINELSPIYRKRLIDGKYENVRIT